MTSRERVLTAIEHREPDRVPFDLGSSASTTIHIIAYRNLLNYLGIPSQDILIFDNVGQTAVVDESVLKRLNVDTRSAILFRSLETTQEGYPEVYTDLWGITRRRANYQYDVITSPLTGDITEKDVQKYPWPTLSQLINIEDLEKRVRDLDQQGEYAVILSCPQSISYFTQLSLMRGFEDIYCDLALNPSLACSYLDKLLEVKMQHWDEVLAKVGKYVQIVREGDDVCGQNGPLISPSMYRKYIKPRQKKLYSFIKKKAGHPVYLEYHCCGSVYDFLPDFIEVGVDILNPVQVSATKMDTRKLKKEFGDAITFCGGVDTQRVLPHGSPQEVRDEVKRRIEDLATGGGYIFATVHNIQADVPPENIMAMWEALQEFGKY